MKREEGKAELPSLLEFTIFALENTLLVNSRTKFLVESNMLEADASHTSAFVQIRSDGQGNLNFLRIVVDESAYGTRKDLIVYVLAHEIYESYLESRIINIEDLLDGRSAHDLANEFSYIAAFRDGKVQDLYALKVKNRQEYLLEQSNKLDINGMEYLLLEENEGQKLFVLQQQILAIMSGELAPPELESLPSTMSLIKGWLRKQ